LACKRVSSDTGANHYYSSTSCHANAEVASLVTTLDEAVPSAEPTAEPTSRPPTAAPTTTQPHLVEFKATQTISGITLADYNADLETNELVLQKTVISVMPGVELTDLYDWTVTEGTSRRRLSNHIVTSLRALTRGFTTLADSIDLSYTVRTETQMSAETLQALLEDSIDNGTFNENLQALAEEADAEDLLDATSGPVTTSAVDSNSDSSSNKLSGGAVAGIVIGVVFGVILLALIAYYFVAGNHGKAANTGAPREGDYTVAL
jgi:cell wall integrity and stress response component